MNYYTFAITAFLLLQLTGAQEHWGYPDAESADGTDKFPTWGGMCDTGKNQSPINLSLKTALKGVFQRFKFSNYNDYQKDVTMVNNGHSIQLSNFPLTMQLSGGPLLDDYVVEQIHFHWWSEHTIDNIRYPLEVHIVHRNKRYANVTTAINNADGLTVIGILFHVSNEHNDAFDAILQQIDEVKNYTSLNKPTTLKQHVVVSDLFPVFDGYLTYAGSLTTPSCAEAVTWIVLHETYPITLEQVNKFKEIEYAADHKLNNNYRYLQKINNRAVTVAFDSDDKDGANGLKFSFAFTFLVMFVAKLLQ